MAKLTTTETLIGEFMVDSGQFIITDPCYLEKWRDEPFSDVRMYRHKDTGAELRYPHDFRSYEEPIASADGKTMNSLVASGEWRKFEEAVPPAGYGYSYNGACKATLGRKGSGVLGGGLAVACRTAHGDGLYPVYAIHDASGELLRVEIRFT